MNIAWVCPTPVIIEPNKVLVNYAIKEDGRLINSADQCVSFLDALKRIEELESKRVLCQPSK